MTSIESEHAAEATPGSPAARRQRIYAVVRAIPPGSVASYGDVALLAGLPRGARQVGRALRESGDIRGEELPWHRVLRSDGRLAFTPGSAAARRQGEQLRDEGVVCARGRVNMSRYRWRPKLDELLWGPLASL
jgi:methylated-DNA-protein-cysteine methyltransferase-like protein